MKSKSLLRIPIENKLFFGNSYGEEIPFENSHRKEIIFWQFLWKGTHFVRFPLDRNLLYDSSLGEELLLFERHNSQSREFIITFPFTGKTVRQLNNSLIFNFEHTFKKCSHINYTNMKFHYAQIFSIFFKIFQNWPASTRLE